MEGYPPHRCFAQRVWICLILKELILDAATKSSEEYENKRVSANYRREFSRLTGRRLSQLGCFVKSKLVTLRSGSSYDGKLRGILSMTGQAAWETRRISVSAQNLEEYVTITAR